MSEIIVKMEDYIKIKGGEYVQDLIRCRDCRHWEDCLHFQGEADGDHFCGKGEPK